MEKKIWSLVLAGCLSAALTFSSFAGEWKQNDSGWWYQNDDGSYLKNGWYWLDGNGDGISENYYFDENGYCLKNAVTPDGYTVNESGAWIIDGIVQTQAASMETQPAAAETTAASTVAETAAAETVAAKHTGISASPYTGYTIVVNTSTKKYHMPSCKSVSAMKEKNTGYCSDAAYLESMGYSACKNCH